MKIVVFLYSLGDGGAERVATGLTGHWAARGHDVTVLTLASDKDDFYELGPRVSRESLGLTGDSGGALTALVSNLGRLHALRRSLRRHRPDVCLALMNTANVLLALAGAGLPGRRFGSERVHPPTVASAPAWGWLRRQGYALLDGVVAQTGEAADWLRRHTRARDVVVIPNPLQWPLPTQQPVIDPADVCRPGRRILLGAGRLVQQKQFEHAIEAMAALHERYADWDLVIVGEGPERERLQRLVDDHALSGRVFLPGRVGNVGQWYSRADLFLMCSRFEGFPNALLEAMACGCPAVSYDCDTGPRDLIRHGLDGMLVPPGSLLDLVRALGVLMGNDDLRAGMGSAAADVRERFAADRILSAWDALVEQPSEHRP